MQWEGLARQAKLREGHSSKCWRDIFCTVHATASTALPDIGVTNAVSTHHQGVEADVNVVAYLFWRGNNHQYNCCCHLPLQQLFLNAVLTKISLATLLVCYLHFSAISFILKGILPLCHHCPPPNNTTHSKKFLAKTAPIATLRFLIKAPGDAMGRLQCYRCVQY